MLYLGQNLKYMVVVVVRYEGPKWWCSGKLRSRVPVINSSPLSPALTCQVDQSCIIVWGRFIGYHSIS